MLKTTDTIANMQSIIDTTIASGGTLIIFTHDLVASAPVSPNTTIAAWQGIVDYVCSQMQLGNCKVPTLSEWHDSLF
jgi:ABC-type Fe2+-enterobactin transport system substrate-binding protein